MNEEASLHEQVQKGVRVTALMDDDLFKDMVRRVEARLFKQWRESSLTDAALREQLYFTSRALREIQTECQKDVENGQIAQATLARRYPTRKGN